MSVAEKLTAIADAIRAKTGGTELLSLDEMATEINSISVGEEPSADPDKIIKKTATGIGAVLIDDVSETKHDIKVTTAAGAKLKVMGKNLLPFPYADGGAGDTKETNGITFTVNNDGSLTLNGTATATAVFYLSRSGSGFELPAGEYVFYNIRDASYYDGLTLTDTVTGAVTELYNNFSDKGKKITIDNKSLIVYRVTVGRGITVNNLVVYPQVELGCYPTSYEPYKDPVEYTADTSGNITIPHSYPSVYIGTNEAVDVTVEYNRSFGMEHEWISFWDAYQHFGSRTNYERAFAGEGWTDLTFKPKYKVTVVNNAYMMFAATGITEITTEKVDFSKATSFVYTFYYPSKIRKVEIDCSSASQLSDSFQGGTIEDITLFNVNEKTKFSNTFNGGAHAFSSVTNLSISGVIGMNGLNIQYLTNVSKQNLLDILNCLKDYSTDTSGTTWTVTFGETNLAKLTAEEQQIAYDKGWVLG